MTKPITPGPPTLSNDDPRRLPRTGTWNGHRVTVYAIAYRGEYSTAAIAFDNGGRGQDVPLFEIIFDPLTHASSVEWVIGRLEHGED